MSWQCPNCETVNQDVTPVCTVCDHLAPVIDSFLSLEGIQLQTEYNAKLDEVYALESSGEYEQMLQTALEAISIYRENALAVGKAKQALQHIQNCKFLDILFRMLTESVDKKNLNMASALIKIFDLYGFDDSRFDSIKKDLRAQISRKNEVDKILDESYKLLVELKTPEALRVVEEGLKSHSTSKRLQFRRDEIQCFMAGLNNIKKSEGTKKKPFPKPNSRPTSETETTPIVLSPPTPPSETKRKFPKVKRK